MKNILMGIIAFIIAFDITSIFTYMLWWCIFYLSGAKPLSEKYGWATFKTFLGEYKKYNDWDIASDSIKFTRKSTNVHLFITDQYQSKITPEEIYFGDQYMLFGPFSYLCFYVWCKAELKRLNITRKIKWS